MTFWADEIKGLRSEPAQRLRIALRNIPLPAAYREAMIAVRALIRQRKKEGAPFENMLSGLYWLAAMSSFGITYSERAREPGFNILQSIPKRTLLSFKFTYQDLGYERLPLLNKTDVKWIVDAWGEPGNHATLQDLHGPTWDKYENAYCGIQSVRRDVFIGEITDLLREAQSPARPPSLFDRIRKLFKSRAR